ncbi:MAG: hypothetical protein RL640_585, partial [Bacteroidota bacterium]
MASKSFAFNILHKDVQDELIIGHNGMRYKVDKAWAKINSAA